MNKNARNLEKAHFLVTIITHIIIPAAFGTVVDRFEDVARGFILDKREPVG